MIPSQQEKRLMIKKAIFSLAVIVFMQAVAIFAEQSMMKLAEGTLTLTKKTFQLKNAIAYESTAGDEDQVAVVLSAQPISSEKLKKALATEKEGGFGEFPQPFLKLMFNNKGELKHWSAVGGGTTVGGSSDGTGELKLQNGHAVGKATATVDPSALIPKGFDVRFDVALLKAGEELAASTPKKSGPAANVRPTVAGTFTGNSKDGKLSYVSARWSEPFDGKAGITLLFTEKDHSKDKKPDTDVMFGKFGNALIISLHEDGSIYSCQVVHSALKNKGFSSSGSIDAAPFTYENGKVEGELSTNGEVDTFGEKWEVKLKFVAPLGEIPKEYQVAESTDTKQASPKSEESEPVESEKKTATKSAVPGLNANDLALTKDAADVNYSALVGQIDFKSKLPVKRACADLTANLKAQGWAKDSDDLITPASSILNRKRGSAKLTIFVKPDAGGSKVKMMTEGLSWDGQ